jgi:DNA recombination protein RmuC
MRPDMIVRLPSEKKIVVDSKAVITAYIEASQTDDENEKKAKLQEHARNIRARVSDLSKKSYWDKFDDTPEFVVLFLPGEVFFSAALEADPTLIELSVDQRVIIATPTTLIALLKATHYGWRQVALAENAQQISELGRELYKRIFDMNTHFEKLGQRLGMAVESYNSTLGSLESRVMVTARKFKDLKADSVDRELLQVEPIDIIARQLISKAEQLGVTGGVEIESQ